MTITVVHEDTEELKKWGCGLDTLLEHCVFCDATTPYWHKRTNTPVCQSCAKTHKVTDIKRTP